MSRAYYGLQTGAAFFQGMMDAFNRATAMQADIARFERQARLQQQQLDLQRQELDLRKDALTWNKQTDSDRLTLARDDQKFRQDIARDQLKLDQDRFDLAKDEQAFRERTTRRQQRLERERFDFAKQEADWRKTEATAGLATKLLEAQNNALLALQLSQQQYNQKKDALLRQYQSAQAFGNVMEQSRAKSELDALENQWASERLKLQQMVDFVGQQASVYQQAFPDSPILKTLPQPQPQRDVDVQVPSVMPATPPSGAAVPYQPGPAPARQATALAMVNPKTGSQIVFAPNQEFAPFDGNLVIDRNGVIYNDNLTRVGEYADYIKNNVLENRKDLIAYLNEQETRKSFVRQASKILNQMVIAGHETSVDAEQFAQAAASKIHQMATSLLQKEANRTGTPLMPHEYEILNDYARKLTLEAIDKTDYSKFLSPERKRFRDMVKEYAEKHTLPGGMLLTRDLQGPSIAVRVQPEGLPEGARADALSRFVYEDFEKHAPGWFKGWQTSQQMDWLNINAPTPAKYNDYLNQFRSRLTDYLNKNPMAAQAAAQRITVVEDGQLRPAQWGKDNDKILYYAETLLRQKFLTEAQAPSTFFRMGQITR